MADPSRAELTWQVPAMRRQGVLGTASGITRSWKLGFCRTAAAALRAGLPDKTRSPHAGRAAWLRPEPMGSKPIGVVPIETWNLLVTCIAASGLASVSPGSAIDIVLRRRCHKPYCNSRLRFCSDSA
jgi:hypothetical protein